MARCYRCNKLVWPWQDSVVYVASAFFRPEDKRGEKTYHAKCWEGR